MYIPHHFTEGTLHFDTCEEILEQIPKAYIQKGAWEPGPEAGSHKRGGH